MSVFSSAKSYDTQLRPDTNAQQQDRDAFYGAGNMVLSGMPYKGSRTGVDSILDADLHRKNLEKEQAKIGASAYKLAYKTAKGQPLAFAVVEHEGKSFVTNAEGEITYVNEDFIDEEYEKAKKQEEYIHSLVKKARTDEILQTMLTISRKEMIDICGVGGGGKIKIEGDLVKVSCLPSEIVYYPRGSTLEAQAFQKLSLVVRAFLPVLKRPGKATKAPGININEEGDITEKKPAENPAGPFYTKK